MAILQDQETMETHDISENSRKIKNAIEMRSRNIAFTKKLCCDFGSLI